MVAMTITWMTGRLGSYLLVVHAVGRGQNSPTGQRSHSVLAAVSAIPWLAGIFTTDVTRLVWWTVAIGLDYAGGVLDFPTPRLG